MRHFNGLKDAIDFDLFMTPVKLAHLARRKDQGNKGLLAAGGDGAGLPLFDETLNAVVGPGIALGLQAFKESLSGSALCFGQVPFSFQPLLQDGLKPAEFRLGLPGTLVGGRCGGFKVLAHGRTGEFKVTGNGADTFVTNEMTTPDFGNDVHG
ncbi:Uncharacterised protein [Iodobacter fluviatilis]|uniref:Uncharacterized protein n=1 Tax=Iodobacter fluviatilis TaxID=537 RepID=A0A377Q6E3_9NEIS|nr:Uncharacterised protein [Iodobacter fluviatilis]